MFQSLLDPIGSTLDGAMDLRLTDVITSAADGLTSMVAETTRESL